MGHPAEKSNKRSAAIGIDATLRSFSGYRMKRAFNAVQGDLTKVLRPFGLRMLTYSALAFIADNPGLRQSQLAKAMDMERPNLVGIIDQLERKKWIRRDPVPTDRRAHALVLTEVGEDLFSRASVAVAEHDRKAFSGLSEKELADLHRYLKIIESVAGGGTT